MKKGIYFDSKTNTYYIDTRIKVRNKYHHCIIKGFSSIENVMEHYDDEISKWKRNHRFYENNSLYEDVLDEFYYYRSLILSSESVRKSKTQFNTFWNTLFLTKPLTDVFDVKNMTNIYKDIIDDVSIKERKKYEIIKSFRDFMKFSYQHKYISIEVYEDLDIIMQPLKLSRAVEKEKRVLAGKEIEKLLSTINKESNDYVMFSLFVFLGARISEFLGLCVNSVDLAKRKIVINKQYLPSGTISNQLKTSNSYRKVLISQEMKEMLNKYMENNGLASKSEERLFKISQVEFKRRLRKYERKAGIKDYSPHEFRHTKATRLAGKCKNISDVVLCAHILGHSPSMFLNTYCHDMSNQKEEKFF